MLAFGLQEWQRRSLLSEIPLQQWKLGMHDQIQNVRIRKEAADKRQVWQNQSADIVWGEPELFWSISVKKKEVKPKTRNRIAYFAIRVVF